MSTLFTSMYTGPDFTKQDAKKIKDRYVEEMLRLHTGSIEDAKTKTISFAVETVDKDKQALKDAVKILDL